MWRARMKRVRWVIAAVVCAGAIVFMVSQLGANLNYMEPVSKAVKQRESVGDKQIRIGGIVVPGTLATPARGGASFELAEGGVVIAVALEGTPHETVTNNPDGCAPVVVEGHWTGTTFAADRMLLKHGAEYDDDDHPIGDAQDDLDCNA